MSNPMVAVACCRRAVGADPTDLYPDPDAGPLQAALHDCGAETAAVSWDEPAVAWHSFSHVVVSSTWDSVDRPAEYLRWARSVSTMSRLINQVDIIEWNLDKVHHRELAAAGVPVIPTTWVAPGDAWAPPTRSEFVVKPSVSAGARNTARYAPGDDAAQVHVQRLHARGQTVMVQDYLSAVDTEGEVDLAFFGSAFSHAVRKEPALLVGEGVIEQRPWERMAWSGLATPTADQMAVANRTMAFLATRFARPPAYARVDLIDGPSGTPLVIEVELIDPYLSLDMAPANAAQLARVILDR